MFNLFTFLEPIFPCITQQRQARELAIQIQASARKLNDVSPENSHTSDADIISILKSTCLLLEGLVGDRNSTPTDIQSETSSKVETSEPAQPALVTSYVPPIVSEPELPETAKDLIQLRDWVLMAKTSGTGASAEVIDSFYEKLGEILAKEDVIALEEIGSPYDYERQQIVSIELTDDPSKSDRVCSTVRPGYMFQDLLIRSQEVTLYTFDTPMHDEIAQSTDSIS